MKTKMRLSGVLLFAMFFYISDAFSQDSKKDTSTVNIYDMSLEELMNIKVTIASKKVLSLRESPGIISLITEEDIQSSGASGILYYLTETDASWDAAKSVPFTIISDGLTHEYIIDLKQSALKGVITKILINPTNATGSNMGIDYVEFIY